MCVYVYVCVYIYIYIYIFLPSQTLCPMEERQKQTDDYNVYKGLSRIPGTQSTLINGVI